MTVMKINGLTKAYPTFKLDNVSFQVKAGTIMGFIGKNGAGKSTTIKALLNIINADSGEVEIFGRNYGDNETECKKEIGVVLGGIDFYSKKKLSVIKSITADFYSDRWDENKYTKYIRLFEIDDSKLVSELSSGMRVKFMIALALSHNAKLLILDEPTSGLDPVSRDDLCRIFKNLVKSGERSVFFSTHITSDLERCATHITFIKDGKIQSSLPIEEMYEHYSYLSKYGAKMSLEDIIVAVERKEYDDECFA